MRAIASGRRAGRPALERPKVDAGTPELCARRARLAGGGDPSLTESPLGILLARGLIGREQHDSGRHYASLYRQSVGRTQLSCDRHYSQLIADGGRAARSRDDAAQARIEARFRLGKNRLLAAGRRVCEATENLVVFGAAPRFLEAGLSGHRRAGDTRELEAVVLGLETLAACYGRSAARAGRLETHRAASLIESPRHSLVDILGKKAYTPK